MIKFRIKEMLESKNIKHPHTWLMQIGMGKSTASKILNNKAANDGRGDLRISLKQLTKICLKANCQPNDVFVYDQKILALPQNHVLHALDGGQSWKPSEALQKLNQEELLAVKQFVEGLNKQASEQKPEEQNEK